MFKFILCTLSLFIIAVWSSHSILTTLQLERQHALSQELLVYEDSITEEFLDTMRRVKQLQATQCDDQAINALRVLVNSRLYVQDLGLIYNDKLACTANWGVLKDPLALPEYRFETPLGYKVYERVTDLFPSMPPFNMTQRGNVLAIAESNLLKNFYDRELDFSFGVITKTNQVVLDSYQSKHQYAFVNHPFEKKTELCSPKYNYCIYTSNNRPGIFFFSPYIALLTWLLCLLGSLTLSYAVFSFFNKRKSLEHRFRQALANQSLYMEYQPLLCANTNKIVGVESLIRWNDAVYHQVSPELFLTMSETLKLYPKVAEFSVSTSIREMSSILRDDPSFSLSININSFEIQNKDYLYRLSQIVKDNNVRPSQITIEITERIGLPIAELAVFSKRAKSFGFEVHLDDFGTGVSNLVWLTEIDFDAIKIDRIFTNALTDELKRDMVKSIIDLVMKVPKKIIFDNIETEKHYQIIFEGVETEEENAFIKHYAQNAIVQGWYFYKSMPISELKQVLSNNS
jgi:sensor c-di-GMP phosphodiesterase-like protein